MASLSGTIRRWKRIGIITVLGTASFTGLSLLIAYLLLFNDRLNPFERGMTVAILLPIIIGIPVFCFLGFKLEQLRNLENQLKHAASHEPVTDCLNGNVFSAMVESRRKHVPIGPMGRQGALLIVHVNELMSLGLHFGLGWKDEALRLVADTIKGSIRRDDLVGRLGEDEFGVFLPGATQEEAMEVGSRIASAVKSVYFAPQAQSEVLAVAIGGVHYERQVEFDDMFKVAVQGVHAALDGRATRPGIIPLTEMPH